jgi:hypothetical protein
MNCAIDSTHSLRKPTPQAVLRQAQHALSLSAFDAAQADPELAEGSKGGKTRLRRVVSP